MAASGRGRPLLRTGSALLVVALMAALGWFWFQRNFEKKAVWVQPRTLSQQWRHPLTEAAGYLRASGKRAELRQGMELFDVLPPPGTVLILGVPPADGRGVLWQRLYEWVQAGGHVVFAPSREVEGQEAAFLERLGVELVSAKSAACGQSCGPGEEERPSLDRSLLLDAEVEGYRIRLAIDRAEPRLRLRPPHQASWRVHGFFKPPDPTPGKEAVPARLVPAGADWLVRLPLGAGSLTVLSGMGIFMHGQLDEEDNAFLLSALARGHGELWLWVPGVSTSLLKGLIDAVPLFLASLLLLGLCLLWSQQAQLRPRVSPLPPTRRDVLAYFDGAGRFAWRADRATGLIRDNREELTRRLRRHRPQDGMEQMDTGAPPGGLVQEEKPALHDPVHSLQDLVRVSGAMQALSRGMRGAGGRAAPRVEGGPGPSGD